MSTKPQKFFLEAASIRWGREHCRTITAVADVAKSLEDTYFDLNASDPNFSEEQYYVWYDAGTGTDPAISGKTGIQVTISSDDTAAAVASATKTAIDGITDANRFRTTVVSDKITVENRFAGKITAETDAGSTGFTFAVDVNGAGLDLGKTQDGIELAISTEVADVTTNQTGAIVNSQIYQGATAQITANLIELTAEIKDLLISEVTGDKKSLDTGSVSGYGESRLFQDLSVLGGQLVLHPIRLADDDYSSDVVFWNSAPKLESINFDGTAPQQLSTVFDAYLDERYSKKVNLFVAAALNGGDWTMKGVDR